MSNPIAESAPGDGVRNKLAYLLGSAGEKAALSPADFGVRKVSRSAELDPEPEPPAAYSPKREESLVISEWEKCASCSSKAVQRRTYAELDVKYCERCWSSWERCGRWAPAMRLCTMPPRLGDSGLPTYGPQDAFMLPGFLCEHDDLSLFETLKSEIPDGREFEEWGGGVHLGVQFLGDSCRHDAPSSPATLREIVARLEATFGIEASATRLNFYRSGHDYKPLHRDRGRGPDGAPTVTVGASFGAPRELTFMHIKSGMVTTFPQSNGDVFAFTPELNDVFMHGIPRLDDNRLEDQPRLSLILWGSRVTDMRRKNAGEVVSDGN
eukprot:gnl/TRDRNA2_/TRDRNA2_78461_c0_seq1.p1 gnl/TRDRNA2_/TRDRNA2_78461_c0~~gnl/TRDRNA2_/TRDRNA2_78461_c0_seq1.p1  ORF type:complete len:324 (-),score=47.44 gnl/TRDRNA2_/TRDRNA2_78461_c0_seq1:144-1115(-)